VCVLWGSAFGAMGTNHLRISYANSRANISMALERVRSVLEPAKTQIAQIAHP
jgi:aspartate/methionine/tyrosine aminotransferase